MSLDEVYLEQAQEWGKLTRRVHWLQALFIPAVGAIPFAVGTMWVPLPVVLAAVLATELLDATAHKAASASAVAVLRGLSR